MTAQLHTEWDGVIATVSLNRPEALNALSPELLLELSETLEELTVAANLGTLRGLVLTGEGGRAFAAGADIRAMSDMDPAEGMRIGALGQRVTEQLEALAVPVIAAVDGAAIGGGCELAMACDVILATASSRFGQPEVKLGLIPGFGGSVRLPRLVGPARARELIYSGRLVDAAEAAEIGLVLEVCENREALLARARELLLSFAGNGPSAVAASKAVMVETVGMSTHDALARELTGFGNCFATEEMLEGTRAFLEKRAPSFSTGSERGETPA